MSLYTGNEQSKKEIKKAVPFTITSERIKYTDINLTTEAKDLYTKNYKKKSLKEMKEVLNKWKVILYSWSGRQYY